MLKKKINLDKTLILYVSIFAIISLISIYSASMYLSKTLGNLVLKQAMWYAVGILFIFIIYIDDTKVYSSGSVWEKSISRGSKWFFMDYSIGSDLLYWIVYSICL